MSEVYPLAGDPSIKVELRRNARARRLTLRVSTRDGRVTLTMPKRGRVADALSFAESRRDWIAAQLAKLGTATALAVGGEIPIEGQACRVEIAKIRAPQLDGDRLLIPERSAGAPGRAVKAYLKLLARDRLTGASERYANQLGRRFTRITLRDTRSRWGSCSSTGALMYSWRLAMAPPPILAYVAAHEVAHLVEMNHSSSFWAQVERLMPDYEQHRRWLRTHGGELQRIILD